jgi:hypothetical protein
MEPRGRSANGNGNGKTNGNGHGHSHPPAEENVAANSTASFASPPTSERDVTSHAERGAGGFFDRAMERWHALAGRRRMKDAEAQLIARGARERYMSGRNVDRDDRDDTLPGPRNEGAYTYPMPVGERGMERGRHYVSANAPRTGSMASDLPRPIPSMRDGSRSMRPPTVFEERYAAPPRWHREDDGNGWDQAAYDNWEGRQHGRSPAEGSDQWSHAIPRDPRSDYFVPQSDDRRAASMAPFGEGRGPHRDEGDDRYAAARTPAWRGRDQGRR